MLDPKRLAKIRELCTNAQYGYAVVNNQIYYKDVTELLVEREELIVQATKGLISDEVVANLERLTSINKSQQVTLEEQRIELDRCRIHIVELEEELKKAIHKRNNLLQHNETLKQLVELLNEKKQVLDESTLETVRQMPGLGEGS